MVLGFLLSIGAENLRKKLDGKFDPFLEEILCNFQPNVSRKFLVRVVRFFKPYKSPAFALGGSFFPGWCCGYIFVEDKFLQNFTQEEVKWILLHELGHIVADHSITSFIFQLPEILSEMDQSLLWMKIIKDFGKLSQILKEGISTEEKTLKEQEFEADKFATLLTSKEVALSVLSKLQKKYGNVSHASEIFGFEFPYLFISERIERIKRDC